MYPQYLYEPLPPVAEIGKTPPFSRLLRLASGEFFSPLRGSILTVNVDQCPRYESLSYTWGTEAADASIDIDGRHFLIRPNLAHALQHLRLPTQHRYLWVDAICINQADPVEKTRQIRYMRLLYKNAARAIVWLGLKSPGIDLALNLATKLADLESSMRSDPGATEGWDVQVYSQMMLDVINDSPEGSLTFLSELLQREYFNRMWCIQEILACPWAVARCEDLEAPFFDIISTTRILAYHHGQSFGTLPFWHSVHVKCLELRTRQEGDRSLQEKDKSMGPLLHLLTATRDFKATDPRDKIFAIFGISDEGLDPILAQTQIMTQNGKTPKNLEIGRKVFNGLRKFVNEHVGDMDFLRPATLKPDYNKSCLEVYRDFARYEMRRSPRLLHILHHVQHDEPPGGDQFPSWVPKWYESRTCWPAPTGMYLAGLPDGHFPYFAVIHDNPLRNGAVYPNILSIDGFLVDRVAAVSDLMEFDMHSDIVLEQIWQSLFGFDLFPRYEQTYRNGEPLDVAFCITLGLGATGTAMVLMTDSHDSNQSFKGFGQPESDISILQKLTHADVAQFMLDYYNSRGYGDQCPTAAETKVPLSMQGKTYRHQGAIRSLSNNRRVFLTQNGYLGLGPKIVQPGDQVCVLYGGRLPFVIRPVGDDIHHAFIGACYLHDDHIMWGKACEAVRFNHGGCPYRQQTFHLK